MFYSLKNRFISLIALSTLIIPNRGKEKFMSSRELRRKRREQEIKALSITDSLYWSTPIVPRNQKEHEFAKEFFFESQSEVDLRSVDVVNKQKNNEGNEEEGIAALPMNENEDSSSSSSSSSSPPPFHSPRASSPPLLSSPHLSPISISSSPEAKQPIRAKKRMRVFKELETSETFQLHATLVFYHIFFLINHFFYRKRDIKPSVLLELELFNKLNF
jgi:hypothetical protein